MESSPRQDEGSRGTTSSGRANSGRSFSRVDREKFQAFTERVMARDLSFLRRYDTTDNMKFVVVALLQMVCCMSERNPALQKQLFSVISANLANAGTIPRSLLSSELYTIRQKFYFALSRLIKTTQAFLDSQAVTGIDPSPITLPGNVNNDAEEPLMFYDPEDESVGKCRDEYLELSQIGKGGFGKVVKVLDKCDCRVYALKKVDFVTLRPATCMRVLREVKILARLIHPNVVRYCGAWIDLEEQEDEPSHLRESSSCPDMTSQSRDASSLESSLRLHRSDTSSDIIFARSGDREEAPSPDDETAYNDSQHRHSSEEHTSHSEDRPKRLFGPGTLCLCIRMELCSYTLFEWISDRNEEAESLKDIFTAVNPVQCEYILLQLIEAVRYVHSRRIMHRDIKPANVFLKGALPQVMLGDFGLACGFDEVAIDDAEQTPGAPGGHSVGVGTYLYAAPEQLNTSTYNDKVDVFSIGIVTFEMFLPFRTYMERIKCITNLRKGQVVDYFEERWPYVASMIRKMVQPSARLRPSSEYLSEIGIISLKKQVLMELEKKRNALITDMRDISSKLKNCSC